MSQASVLTKGYKDFFEQYLRLLNKKSVTLVIAVLDYIVNQYMLNVKDGKSVFEFSKKEIAKELNVSYQKVSDAVNILAGIDMIEGELSAYDRAYRFPNKNLENSLLSPVSRLDNLLVKAKRDTRFQIENIKSLALPEEAPVVLLDKQEFYKQSAFLLETSESVNILSHTPGIILPNEYDDNDNTERTSYFDTLEKRLKLGLKVRYLFNADAVKKELEAYSKEEGMAVLFHAKKFLSLPNLDVRFIRSPKSEGFVLGKKKLIIGVKEKRSVDPKHAIRGEIYSAGHMVDHFQEYFEQLWKTGQRFDIQIAQEWLLQRKTASIVDGKE